MKKNNKIQLLSLLILHLTVVFVYSQENKKDIKETFNFKHFAVKVHSGYSITNESSKLQVVNGKYDVGNSSTAGLSLVWYYNKNWSLDLSISTGKYKVTMNKGDYTTINMYRNDIDLGYVWMAPVGFSVNYHLTISDNVVPYVSAGGNYILFTNVDPGWGANSVQYQNAPAFHFAIGASVNVTKRWFVDTKIRKFFTDRTDVDVDFESMGWKLKTQFNPQPIDITIGLGYRF